MLCHEPNLGSKGELIRTGNVSHGMTYPTVIVAVLISLFTLYY